MYRGKQSRLSKYREINKKIATLKKPKNISIRPVLIYEGELSESVVESNFFDKSVIRGEETTKAKKYSLTGK